MQECERKFPIQTKRMLGIARQKTFLDHSLYIPVSISEVEGNLLSENNLFNITAFFDVGGSIIYFLVKFPEFQTVQISHLMQDVNIH